MRNQLFLTLLEKITDSNTTLSLENCQLNLINDEQIVALREKINEVSPNIYHINLSGNDLVNFIEINVGPQPNANDGITLFSCIYFLKSLKELFESFKCPHLRSIDLSNCNLGGEVFNSKIWDPENVDVFIADFLLPLLSSRIIHLNLQHNNLGPTLDDEKFNLFIAAFMQFINLKTLDLRNNNFTNEQIKKLTAQYGGIIKHDANNFTHELNNPDDGKKRQDLLEQHLAKAFGTRDEFRRYAKSKGFLFFADDEKPGSSDDNLIIYKQIKKI